MAINPEAQYPGKIEPSSTEYPYGKAQNISTPGDGTGTPWEAALVNDIFGFQQALLDRAIIVPTGTPEEVGASQYLDALDTLFGPSVAVMPDLLFEGIDGQIVFLQSFHVGVLGASGHFKYSSTEPRTNHNGIDIIDPTNLADLVTWDAAAKNTWLFTANAGTGCWIRLFEGRLNVMWAGARGDDTGDDQPPFKGCIDSLPDGSASFNALGTGGQIFTPPGIYRTLSPILVDTTDYGVRLIGGSPYDTIINAAHNGKCIDVFGTDSGSGYTKGFGCKGIGFRTTDTARTVGSAAIRIRYMHYFHLNDLWLVGENQYGIEIEDALDGVISGIRADSVAGAGGLGYDHIIHLERVGSGAPNQITIRECFLEDSVSAAIYLDEAERVTIKDTLIQSNEFHGISFTKCNTLRIEGNYFENNGQGNTIDSADIFDEAAGLSGGVTILNNTIAIDGNTATHRSIDIQDARGFDITQNDLKSASTQIIRIATGINNGNISHNRAVTQPTLDFTGDFRFTDNFLRQANIFWNQYRDSDKIWRQVVTYAASITPEIKLGRWMRVTVTGDLLVNIIADIKDEDEIIFEIIQDATGSHTVTFNSVYKLSAALGSTADRRYIIKFIYDASVGLFYETSQAPGQVL